MTLVAGLRHEIFGADDGHKLIFLIFDETGMRAANDTGYRYVTDSKFWYEG